MGGCRRIGDSNGHGLETLAHGKDLSAACHWLQPQRGSRNRSRGKNLARLVGGSDTGAHLDISGDGSNVKRTVGKPVDVRNGTGRTQRSRSLHHLIIHCAAADWCAVGQEPSAEGNVHGCALSNPGERREQ